MPEEEFKSIRITLSEEAFAQLEQIMNDAKFRSNSSTVEECIRTLYDIIGNLSLLIGKRGDPAVNWSNEDGLQVLYTIISRLQRFTGRHIRLESVKKID